MTTRSKQHPGELTLRRHLAAEPLDEALTSHLRTCADCERKLSTLRDEARAFQAEIPFERFAAGVEKAARVQGRPPARRGALVAVLVAAAAGLVAVVGLRWAEDPQPNRIKGGATVDFVIAGPGGQRPARELERLVAGERLRIGVRGHKNVLALSIDDAGEISPLYEQALPSEAQAWLPDSLEFTGTGREHVVVLLTDAPLVSGEVQRQLLDHFKAASGDLTNLEPLTVPGLQVHRTFLKP